MSSRRVVRWSFVAAVVVAPIAVVVVHTGVYAQLTLEETMGDLMLGCAGAAAFLVTHLLLARSSANR